MAASNFGKGQRDHFWINLTEVCAHPGLKQKPPEVLVSFVDLMCIAAESDKFGIVLSADGRVPAVAEIAEKTKADLPTLTRCIADLESLKLIRRRASGPYAGALSISRQWMRPSMGSQP
jgi:hypothetical protein